MATITVSMKIICPDCGKQMVKKNWKDHARQKHTMTEETIQTKYEGLLPSTSSLSNDKPIAVVMHNFFSTKKFAKSISSSQQENRNDDIGNYEAAINNDQAHTFINFEEDLNSKGNICQIFKRIKSWLRNGLSNSTLEILIKVSALKIDLTDDAIKFIIEDFMSNPQRAKRRNISVFTEYNNAARLDDDVV